MLMLFAYLLTTDPSHFEGFGLQWHLCRAKGMTMLAQVVTLRSVSGISVYSFTQMHYLNIKHTFVKLSTHQLLCFCVFWNFQVFGVKICIPGTSVL